MTISDLVNNPDNFFVKIQYVTHLLLKQIPRRSTNRQLNSCAFAF